MQQANEAMCRIVGYEPEQLVGMHYSEITHPDDLAADDEAARRLFETGRPTRLEKRYRRSDGDWVWVALSISIVFDEAGQPDHVVAQVEDITERKAIDDVLAHQARHDHLTGLLNRHAFDSRLEQAMARRHFGRGHVALPRPRRLQGRQRQLRPQRRRRRAARRRRPHRRDAAAAGPVCPHRRRRVRRHRRGHRRRAGRGRRRPADARDRRAGAPRPRPLGAGVRQRRRRHRHRPTTSHAADVLARADVAMYAVKRSRADIELGAV